MNLASATAALPSSALLPVSSEPLRMSRLLIVMAVLGLHALVLWALQNGLLHRAVEIVVPVRVLAELIEAPKPVAAPSASPSAATPSAPRPGAPPTANTLPKTLAPLPVLQPSARVAPSPVSAGAINPGPEWPLPAPVETGAPPADAAQAVVPATSATAQLRIELPSSSGGYLNNPPPPYPPLSKRLGEQGKVVVRALIEVNGAASKAEVRSSSGYERLDRAAVQTVLQWRYTPGKRAGAAEAMWFDIPITFVLE